MKMLLAVLVLSPLVSALWAAEAAMTAEERAKTLQWLRESQKQFLDLVSDVSDAGWTYKPAPDRWSVAETAEHIMLAERTLFGNVEKALGAASNPDWETKTAGKTEFIERVMPDRSRRAQAPESVVPKSDVSRAEILRRFQENRARVVKFAEVTQLPLKAHTVDHPFPVFNTLNAYQWLIYVPLHTIRHNQQIAEVKASPGFPR